MNPRALLIADVEAISLVRLNVLSDLHLSLGALTIPENDADVVILAGDLARPRQAVAWASGFAKPVLYVPGNHEFYGGGIEGTVEEPKRLRAEPPSTCSTTTRSSSMACAFWEPAVDGFHAVRRR